MSKLILFKERYKYVIQVEISEQDLKLLIVILQIDFVSKKLFIFFEILLL